MTSFWKNKQSVGRQKLCDVHYENAGLAEAEDELAAPKVGEK